jgi:hypothetical protein
MMKNVESMQKFSLAQMEAVTIASAVMTKGMQNIAEETSAFSKKYFEMSSSALQELLGAKALDKAFEIQTTFAKQAHESIVTQATKVSEIYTSLAMEMKKPFHDTSVKDVVEVAAPVATKSKAVAQL